jgi:AhpD family alkylhydroperoxidase
MTRIRHALLLAATIATVAALSPAPRAEDANAAAEAAYADIQKTFGAVPEFVKAVPKAAIAGAWREEKDLELSDKTALPPKVKALISLAVAAQIPCEYCIYADTKMARQFGASDEEVKEAVAMSALTRHWSTILNGNQIDFAQFKKEMGGQ